ncbi:MAG: IS110 family transposase [Candidatus Limnocylindrales bacterium]
MRSIGLDLGRHKGEAAAVDGRGRAVGLGSVEVSPAGLVDLIARLRPDDRVVLEASTNTWSIAELLAPHVAEVVVSNPLRTRAIAEAKVKTDRIDAATLAELLAADYIPAVWQPDPDTLARRRLVSLRASLVRGRTGERNRVAAVIGRRLATCPVSDPFGVTGRAWLEGLDLPADERLALAMHLRLHDAIAAEIQLAEAAIARSVRDSAYVRHMLSVPGIGLTTAAALDALIGDIGRFGRPNKLVGYLGLDPAVRQSGARSYTGHISRAGQAHARALLIEAAHAAVRTPGPLAGFYLRVRRRRGTGIAIVAVARKLAVLVWHLLSHDVDYAWSPPSASAAKIRRLELLGGDERRLGRTGIVMGGPGAARAARLAQRARERVMLTGAQAAYERFVASRSARADAATASGERLDDPAGPEPAAPRS